MTTDISNLLTEVRRLQGSVATLTNAVLHLQDNGQYVDIQDKIRTVVCRVFSVNVIDLVGERRWSQSTVARHVAMYLMSTLTDLSFFQVSKVFNRHPDTIKYAMKAVRDRMDCDRKFKAVVDQITSEVKGTPP